LSRQEEKNLSSGSHLSEWEVIAFDFLDGVLRPEVAALVRQHLDSCPACRSELEAVRLGSQALQGQPLADPPPGMESLIFARLDQAEASPSPAVESPVASATPGESPSPRWRAALGRLAGPFAGRRPAVWVPAAAALVLLVVVGLGQLGGQLPGDDELFSPAEAPDATATVEGESFALESDQADEEAMDGTLRSAEGHEEGALSEEVPPGVADLQILVVVGGDGASLQETATQLEDLTGLEPTPRQEWPGRPAYAVAVRAEELEQVKERFAREGLRVREEADDLALPYVAPEEAAALPLLEPRPDDGFQLREPDTDGPGADAPGTDAPATTEGGLVTLLLVIAED
jgi:hypothetical protein